MIVPKIDREGERMDALRRYCILDTPPEPEFDDLAALATFVCSTPIALVSLVDDERQWSKARIGLDICETQRMHAFCPHAILEDGVFEVQDATADERFNRSPLVTGKPQVRYYAGTPLRSADGHALGTLCVMDRRPRRLSKTAHDALVMLARQAERMLHLRMLNAELAQAQTRVHTLHGLLPVCMYCRNIRDEKASWQRIESYVRSHIEIEFSHGVCSDCLSQHYSEVVTPQQ
jgi:GAF domain-containing protein